MLPALLITGLQRRVPRREEAIYIIIYSFLQMTQRLRNCNNDGRSNFEAPLRLGVQVLFEKKKKKKSKGSSVGRRRSVGVNINQSVSACHLKPSCIGSVKQRRGKIERSPWVAVDAQSEQQLC